MSVSDTDTRVSYVGDAATTAFAASGFEYKASTQLKVKRWTTATQTRDDATALTLGVDYTISGSAPSNTVNMTTAPTAAQTLEIYRYTSPVQAIDLSNVGAFDADNLETAGLDKLVMMIQELTTRIADLETRVTALE